MRIIYIGSFLYSEDNSDIDVICSDIYDFNDSKYDVISPINADFDYLFSGKLDAHLELIASSGGVEFYIPSMELLSHIYRSHLTSFRKKWWKQYLNFQMKDLVDYYLNSKDPILFEYSKAREKEYRRLSKTRAWTLKGMTREEFFGDNVKYYQDHDSVHKAIAFEPGVPSYTYMQEPGSEVECSRSLWLNMTEQQRLNCVKEEMAVIAIERFIAPLYFNDKFEELNKNRALRISLYKLLTTLSSGWFRDYVVIHGLKVYQELSTDSSWLKRWLLHTKEGKILSY